MSVWVGDCYSAPLPVLGGSPQGSILGNYLFCSTTDQLAQNIDYSAPADVSLSNMSGGSSFDGSILAESGIIGQQPDNQNTIMYDDSMLDESIAYYRNKQIEKGV